MASSRELLAEAFRAYAREMRAETGLVTEAELRLSFVDYAVVLLHDPKDLISWYRVRAAERAAEARAALATHDNSIAPDPDELAALKPIVLRPVRKVSPKR